MLDDLRQAARTLRRQPAFTVLALAVLALGIGSSTALFSVVSAVLLRPLPYADPDRLVVVWDRVARLGLDRNLVSPSNLVDWQSRNDVFERLDGFTENFLNLSGDEGPAERIYGLNATAGFFDTLGVRAARGRVFRPADVQATVRPVVISHGLWQRRFGGDPGVVGRHLTLNATRREIVGVVPPGFLFLGKRFDVFQAMSFTEDQIRNSRGGRWLTVVGRLKPGVGVEQAQSGMDAVTARLAVEYPEVNEGRGAWVRSLKDELVGGVRPALLLLLGFVLLVLLIAAANVANLQLARSWVRARDLATRAALGATRARLVRTLLAESLLLGLSGGVAGMVLAAASRRVMLAAAPADVPRIDEMGLDARVLAFAVLVTFAATLVSGLLPALQASRRDVHDALKEGGRMVTGGGPRRAQRSFVVAQVALSLTLLAAAGLLVKSFLRLQNVDPGFVHDEAVAMDLSLGAAHGDLAARARFFEELLVRVHARPGVRAAGLTSDLPLGGETSRRSFTIVGAAPAAAGKLDAEIRRVSARYFEAMGMRMRRGRALTASDRDALVVNEALARRFFPGVEALGRRIVLEEGPRRSREIVGVVGDVKHFGLDAAPPPEIYLSHIDRPWPNMTLVVRAVQGAPARLAEEVRRELAALDPGLPMANVKTVEQYVAASIAGPRFSTRLAGIFSVAAVLLAALGVYGVMAGSVAQRTPEIGVRMALGANARDVRRLVLGEGLRLIGAGVVVGMLGALVLGRAVQRMLYEVSAADPAVFGAVAAGVAAVALLAAYLPARRASRLPPTIAMRSSML